MKIEPKTKEDAEFEAFARSLGFIPGIAGNAAYRFLTFQYTRDAKAFIELATQSGVYCSLSPKYTALGEFVVRSKKD